jgi:dienelactone hydrolase
VPADPLDDFEAYEVTYDGDRKTVYRKGTGPAVIVISEVPGITPAVADFARRVEAIGCTVALPVLFGEPGREMSAGYATGVIARACISREFATWMAGRTSPVTAWLRHLARDLHDEVGGPGVGAVGMCLTGGFALAMMVDDTVVAPVLSQPSLPFPVTKKHKADVGISAEDLSEVKRRVADDGIDVLGLRFTCDRFVPEERFDTLERELGERFIRVEIDSSDGNPHDIPKTAHSVLTDDCRPDDPEHPTRHALDRVLDLFRERLLGGSPSS